MRDFLAAVGCIHLVFDAAIILFLCWFTYESRQTAKTIDQMEDRDDDPNDY